MKVTASGSVTGIAYWFTLQLFEDIVISTAPAAYPEVSSEGHREELYFITQYNYNPSYSGCIADSIFILFFRVIKITCTGSEGVFFASITTRLRILYTVLWNTTFTLVLFCFPVSLAPMCVHARRRYSRI